MNAEKSMSLFGVDNAPRVQSTSTIKQDTLSTVVLGHVVLKIMKLTVSSLNCHLKTGSANIGKDLFMNLPLKIKNVKTNK